MTDTLHLLVERYGLVAVFLGCVAEGESAAILGGFLAHQRVFEAWQALAAVALGAFLGDTMFFLTGRLFADHPFVSRLRGKPGFGHAYRLVREHPTAYVLLNRYAYGFRLVGGVAAGLSGIAMPKFLVLNALSSLIWAMLFGGIGYVFGLGAERLIGGELARHHRLLMAGAIVVGVTLVALYVAHRRSRNAGDRH